MSFSHFLGAKFFITAGFPQAKRTSEIITVFKQGDKVTSTFSKLVTDFPKETGFAFGGKCDDKILVGEEKDMYQYKIEEDEWIPIEDDEHPQSDRTCAQACSIQDMYLVCGGTGLHTNVELVQSERDVSNVLSNTDASYEETTDGRQLSCLAMMDNKQHQRNQSHVTQAVSTRNSIFSSRLVDFNKRLLNKDTYV